MSRDDTLKTVLYVGQDPQIAKFLKHRNSGDAHRLEQCRTGDWPLPAIQPSWRCRRVVVLDHFEQASSRRLLEDLFRHDAGIPVVVLMERQHAESLTYAGLARMHGAHRLVLKPLADRQALWDAIENAFQRIDHWAFHLSRPCAFEELAFQPRAVVSALVEHLALAAPGVFGEASRAAAMAGT